MLRFVYAGMTAPQSAPVAVGSHVVDMPCMIQLIQTMVKDAAAFAPAQLQGVHPATS